MRSRASTSMAATPPASIACHELGARGEREVLATPQAEPLGVGEIVHGGGAGGRDVDDAGVGQACCRRSPARPCCDGRLLAALALAAGGIRHGMAFVEHDHSIEVRAQPIDDLLDPRNLSSRASVRSVA